MAKYEFIPEPMLKAMCWTGKNSRSFIDSFFSGLPVQYYVTQLKELIYKKRIDLSVSSPISYCSRDNTYANLGDYVVYVKDERGVRQFRTCPALVAATCFQFEGPPYDRSLCYCWPQEVEAVQWHGAEDFFFLVEFRGSAESLYIAEYERLVFSPKLDGRPIFQNEIIFTARLGDYVVKAIIDGEAHFCAIPSEFFEAVFVKQEEKR